MAKSQTGSDGPNWIPSLALTDTFWDLLHTTAGDSVILSSSVISTTTEARFK